MALSDPVTASVPTPRSALRSAAAIAIAAGGVVVSAAAVVGTLRARAGRAHVPRARTSAVPVPALPGGAGLFLVVASGTAPAPRALRGLSKATVVGLGDHDDLDRVLRIAAVSGRYRAIGVALPAAATNDAARASGVPSLLSVAAAVAVDTDLPLAVFPVDAPDDLVASAGIHAAATSVAAVRNGSGVAVDLGAVSIDGGVAHPVVDGVLIGLPDLDPSPDRTPHALPTRAVRHALQDAEPFRAEVDGRPRRLLAVIASLGDRGDGMLPEARSALDDGTLDVRLITPGGAHGGSGADGGERIHVDRSAPRSIRVALTAGIPHTEDDTTQPGSSHPHTIRVEVHPRALRLYAPTDGRTSSGRRGTGAVDTFPASHARPA